jgi:hypothetical protein
MVTPFGFSVGDVIAGIGVLRGIFIALSQSKGASKEYLELIKALRSLENALRQVRAIYDEIENPNQLSALRQEVSVCEETIDTFTASLDRYHGHLSNTGTKSFWKDSIQKIRWHFVKSCQLSDFREQLTNHVSSLEVILLSIQISTSKLQKESNSALEGPHIPTSISHIGNLVFALERSLSSQANDNRTALDLLHILKEQVSTNSVQQAQIYSRQLELLNAFSCIQSNIPAQVMLQQPFTFIDALDRRAPVHLEWINSWDAFISVLKVRFKEKGVQKINGREFVLRCARLNRDIDFQSSWEISFLPGRVYDMSMLFRQVEDTDTALCVVCKYRCGGRYDEDIKW